MKNGRLSLLLITLFAVLGLCFGPGASPASAADDAISWTVRLEPEDLRPGEHGQIVLEATLKETWYLYSMTRVEMGPRPTTFTLDEGSALTQVGDPVQPEPQRKHDEGFDLEVEIYPGAVAFGIPVQLAADASGSQEALVRLRYQVCDPTLCLDRREEMTLTFTAGSGPARSEFLAPVTGVPAQPAAYGTVKVDGAPPAGDAEPEPAAAATFNRQLADAQSKGLLPFLLFSLGMGFLALLTPCVFPMVPITVSFFAKQQEVNPRAGIAQALAYCLGIVATFTGLGLALTLVFGASGIQILATNPWVNLGLATLFIVLAINLFGGFEIILPGWMVQRAHSGTSVGGLFVGPILMGLAFTLTSFTCTVPFVGTLLATTTQGQAFWPVVGMLAFSTAFASPFFLLARFPHWLAKLPRSGSWLITVKAFMGFLELAAAVKFLSNADLVWALGLLTRPVFLSLWSTIALVGAVYMLGWLRLPHEAGPTSVGPVRRGIGLLTAVAGFWCLAGLGGRSLGEMEAFLPPSRYPGKVEAASHGPVNWILKYDEGMEIARREGKPVFLNFTGVTCTNCRWMEKNMFTRPEIVAELQQFVTIELFTDLPNNPESDRYRKMGLDRYGTAAIPLYAITTPDEEPLTEFPGMERNAEKFRSFLQEGREKFERAARQAPTAEIDLTAATP
jgi:thiol:disulfide interchange protein